MDGIFGERIRVEVRFGNGTAAAKRLVRLLLNKADEFPEFKPFAEMKATGDGGLDRWHGTLPSFRDRLRVGKFKWRVLILKNGRREDMVPCTEN